MIVLRPLSGRAIRSSRSRSSSSLTLGPRPKALRRPELALSFCRSPLDRAEMRSSALGRHGGAGARRGSQVVCRGLGIVPRLDRRGGHVGSTAGRAAYARCGRGVSGIERAGRPAYARRAGGVRPSSESRPRVSAAGVQSRDSVPLAGVVGDAAAVGARVGRRSRSGLPSRSSPGVRLVARPLARLPGGVLPRRAPRVGRRLLGLVRRSRRRRDGQREAARDGVVGGVAGDALALGAPGLVLAHRALLAGLTTCAVPACGTRAIVP